VFLELLARGVPCSTAEVAEKALCAIYRVHVPHPEIVVQTARFVSVARKLLQTCEVMAAFLALPGVSSDCVVELELLDLSLVLLHSSSNECSVWIVAQQVNGFASPGLLDH
jgi:hypothetical protein